jgi:endonuclease IV
MWAAGYDLFDEQKEIRDVLQAAGSQANRQTSFSYHCSSIIPI